MVAILLIALPAYRWFFLISLLIGPANACGLTIWHKLHPIEERDVENKRRLVAGGRFLRPVSLLPPISGMLTEK